MPSSSHPRFLSVLHDPLWLVTQPDLGTLAGESLPFLLAHLTVDVQKYGKTSNPYGVL